MVAGMSFEGGEGILPDAYRAAQNLIRFNLSMPPYAPPWPRPPEPTGPGSGLSGWRPPIPPKPKEIPPWETLPQVTNPPSYTSRSEPPLDAQIDRQILMRETRLRELRATNAKFGAAMKGIAQRDQVWMAIMRQAARDSEWAMVGATRSCVDLLCSTMGPLRALADELRVGSATLPKYQGSVGKGAEYVHSLVEKLSVGLESPALKEGLKGLDKALRETVLAIDIGIGSGQGAEVADRVEELEPWISRVLGAVDEEQNGERKGALMFVAQAGTDIGADVVKDYFMNRLAALGRVTPVQILALADWAVNYSYEGFRFYADWHQVNQLNSCLQSDTQAMAMMSKSVVENTNAIKMLESERSTLLGYRADPRASEVAFKQMLQGQASATADSSKEFFREVEAWGSEPGP